MGRRVVITGLGVVSPLGVGARDHWSALASGRSGVSRIDRLTRLGIPVDVAAEVAPSHFAACVSRLPRKQVKLYNRTTTLAMVAAALAAEDAGLAAPVPDPDRAGVMLATLFIPYPIQSILKLVPDVEAERNRVDLGKALARCFSDVNPLDLSLRIIPNLTAGHLAIHFGLRGACRTVADGWTGGLHAVGQAAAAIRDGALDLVFCGGAECPLEDLVFADLCSTDLLSPPADLPERTCRPFGVGRWGTAAGEVAAVLVLEAEDHAARRGAHVRAECAGFGAAGADPSPEGIRDGLGLAMRAALAGSGRETADAVSLQGDGGVQSDLGEAAALRAFAAATGALPAVYATKGAHGNLFSAAGPVEVIGAVTALEAGAVPPSRNCDETDPACGLALDAHRVRPLPGIRTALVNAVGVYGEAASLAIARAV